MEEKYTEGTRYCPFCGMKLDGPAEPSGSEDLPEKSRADPETDKIEVDVEKEEGRLTVTIRWS